MTEPSVSSLVPQLWADQITQQVEQSSMLSRLFPPPELTRWQRVRGRVRGRVMAVRYGLASWIAGYDVTDTNW